MKKLLCVLSTFAIAASLNNAVFAYQFPHAFWAMNDNYQQAVSAGNHSEVIKYGNEIINLMSGEPDCDEKRDVLITRYNQVGLAYAALGEYDASADTFGKLYSYASQYGNKYGDKFYDYTKVAEAKKEQYTSEISLYTDNGASPNYGAKNEKGNGVLFGICVNGGTMSKLDNSSMVLVYQELGHDLLPYNTSVVRDAQAAGRAVEFALNCPNEGTDISNIQSMEPYLSQISDMLAQYSSVPVYLRFAAEFNVWGNPADAESFKEAFRYVSRYFKDRNSNVAVVWSPNQTSSWNIDADDYYPGDEYVDWVGISLYAQKYFLGDKNQPDDYQIVFKTGRNSDPVIAVRNIVEKYGDRKPIMIAESGCAHTDVSLNEDMSEFAIQRLKEYMAYLPMVYPQIKLMAYFDWYVGGERNDNRLTSNQAMQNAYLDLTSRARFIQNGYNGNTDFCYRKLYDGAYVNNTFSVSCYAHKYDTELKNVTYYIDDNYVGTEYEIPFTSYISAENYVGEHELKAVAMFGNGQTMETRSRIIIGDAQNDISVKISGNQAEFDRNPVLYNNRTMVPMRRIFEMLGVDVTWDDSTQTATGVRGGRTVQLSIGSSIMKVDGKKIVLDTPPIIVSARTLVPVRAVAEGLDCGVNWDDSTSTVLIEP